MLPINMGAMIMHASVDDDSVVVVTKKKKPAAAAAAMHEEEDGSCATEDTTSVGTEEEQNLYGDHRRHHANSRRVRFADEVSEIPPAPEKSPEEAHACYYRVSQAATISSQT